MIFDEIQEVPRALTSLKYFCENAPQYHIVCAGSLLGIGLHEGTSFPVGKVEFLNLYPMTFQEFLMAADHQKYADLLEKCFFVGEQDYKKVHRIQENILITYQNDFSKHTPDNTAHKIRDLWNSLPSAR